MRLRDVVIIFLAGLAYHQTAGITNKMPHGWGYLAGLAFGVEGTLPAFAHILKLLDIPENVRMRAIVAYQIAFLCIGSGVAFGWLLDWMLGVSRE